MAKLLDYHKGRDALINEDISLRREYIHIQARPSEEARADAIMRRIRTTEAESIWNEEYLSIPHAFPGMEFLTAKSIVTKTKLFKLLFEMPKGALLHVHLDATVNAQFLLKLALQQPAMHIRVKKLMNTALNSNLPEFRALPKESFSALPGLTDPSYTVGSWVSLQNARASFDPSLGGPDGFDKWVFNAMTIHPAKAYETYNTRTKIWKRFDSTFDVSGGLISFEPIFGEYIRQFFLSSIEEGISYIETRIDFLFKHMVGADGHKNVSHREWLLVFDRVLGEVKADMKRQGREDEFVGARIIYTTIRSITPAELEWYLEDCIALKKEFPQLIAGFDLVGDEVALRPLLYYIEPLLRFRDRQKQEGVDIPFIFHAGETFGDGTESDLNLYDAILLGTKRIGHGFSLAKHPKLLQICRENEIAIEVCPVSNEILRLTASMATHPLPILLNNGVPVALCSDDPGVFGNLGLTFNFFQVMAASEVTGLSTLGALARDSIQYSTLTDEEKKSALGKWDRRWRHYLKTTVELEGNEE